MEGLDNLCTPELEYRVDSKHNLEEEKGLCRRVILKDVFTSYGKERGEFRSCQETRTLAIFFPYLLAHRHSLSLSFATSPSMHSLIDPILPSSLCSSRPVP